MSNSPQGSDGQGRESCTVCLWKRLLPLLWYNRLLSHLCGGGAHGDEERVRSGRCRSGRPEVTGRGGVARARQWKRARAGLQS